MKKSKAASSTARMSRTTKQQLSQQQPPSSIMSNNENDVSFGNNVGSGEFIACCYCMIYFVLESELARQWLCCSNSIFLPLYTNNIFIAANIIRYTHSLVPSIVSLQQQILHHQTMTITIIITLKNSSICWWIMVATIWIHRKILCRHCNIPMVGWMQCTSSNRVVNWASVRIVN